MSTNVLLKVEQLLNHANNVVTTQEYQRINRNKIVSQLEEVATKVSEKETYLEDLVRAATLLGNVADENTRKTLENITGVINRALILMFKEDGRKISIKQVMYRNVYPHFVVELETADGYKRTFKQSGTGLAQIISFLFTVCLIESRKGRKVMVMDELLNGLHPSAKGIIKDLILVLSKNFQFVIVEYGLDIGRQYEVVKTGAVANIIDYQGEAYYKDLATIKEGNDANYKDLATKKERN